MKHWYCLTILLLGCASTCVADDLGELPAGYTWHTDYPAATAIPVPAGWFIQQSQQGNASVVSMTKESVTDGEFTGLSVQYVANFSAIDSRGPYVYAQERMGVISQPTLTSTATTEKDILREYWVNSYATGVTAFGAVTLRPGSHHYIIYSQVVQVFIADEVHDTLRIVTFQAPETEWASAWQYGKVMLARSVGLDGSLVFGTAILPPTNAQ